MNSFYSNCFNIIKRDVLVSYLRGIIFLSAMVPKSSPITAADFMTMTPLMVISFFLRFFSSLLLPSLINASMSFNLFLWAHEGTGMLVKFLSLMHRFNFWVQTSLLSSSTSKKLSYMRLRKNYMEINGFPSHFLDMISITSSSTEVKTVSRFQSLVRIYLHSSPFSGVLIVFDGFTISIQAIISSVHASLYLGANSTKIFFKSSLPILGTSKY